MITDDKCSECGQPDAHPWHRGPNRPEAHNFRPAVVGDDWERGYAAGYERALQHVLMMAEPVVNVHVTLDHIMAKLRKEVLHDTPDAQR